jgi:hypothetical protein
MSSENLIGSPFIYRVGFCDRGFHRFIGSYYFGVNLLASTMYPGGTADFPAKVAQKREFSADEKMLTKTDNGCIIQL